MSAFKLSIAILEARGLVAKDKNGLSDPFVEIRLSIGGDKEEPKYATRVIEKSLNPVWNERFVFINKRLGDATSQVRVCCLASFVI